jgi:hypothetical protein
MNMMGLALWVQGSDVSLPGVSTNLFLAFLGLLAVAVLLQACVLLAMAMGARKTQKQLVVLLEEFETRINPILDTTRTLLEDTAPKMRIITTNVTEASYILREQAEDISCTVGEINARVRDRVATVDAMISAGIVGVTKAVAAVQESIMGPLNQLNGLLSGIRAGIDILRNRGRHTHSHEDQDMFV